jgi:hypothetical protein
VIRAAVLLFALASACPAWVESVEFPWNAYPQWLWERELVWLKNIGITHVSLPVTQDISRDTPRLTEVIQIIRRLDIEADLEGVVPDSLMPLTRAHGGPLTAPLQAARISVLNPNALTDARELLASGAPALIWTGVEDTLSFDTGDPGATSGYHPGAISLGGEERPAVAPLRRNAQLSLYWGKIFSTLHETPAAGVRVSPAPAGLVVRQFIADNGISLVSVVNKSAMRWTGDLKVFYPALKRAIGLPGVSVAAHDSLWLPVGVPLIAGPLCRDCNAFATVDHLVYATAELTGMEYENGILAMEFAAPAGGEVILQLSRQPSGPLVAGGKPTAFDWDEHSQRARLQIPRGTASRVRIGLAIEPPDATAFFKNAHVLLIGETNRLTAEFSSEAIAGRSRLRAVPAFPAEQEPADEKNPLALTYDIRVPKTAVHGDYATLALESDGRQMSHARPQLLRPASLRFADAIEVHLAANSALQLSPAIVPVNQKTGRDLTVTLRNNAPEIRNFDLELTGEGLEFSPAKLAVSVGASLARDISFRVFAQDAAPGIHAVLARLSGAVSLTEAVQFVVIPQTGAVAFQAGDFSLLESAKIRASFIPGRWLEFLDKEKNQNLLASQGMPFTPGRIEAKGDSLVFAGQKILKLEDLQGLAPKRKQ